MTFIPEHNLKGRHLIAQFVLHHRKRGLVLPYSEYDFIDKWLKLTASEDQLLLLLSDIVPKFYQDRQDWTHPPSLKLIDSKVCKMLMAKRNQRLGI
jgi:hypothetical protein